MEHPEGDLENQTPNFGQGTRTLIGKCSWAITVTFPNPADWNKIQVCKQSLINLLMTINNQLQNVFKQGSCLL